VAAWYAALSQSWAPGRWKPITDAVAVTTIGDVVKKQVEILERVAPRS